MAITRIKNNQITDSTITNVKIASSTLTGDLMNPNLTFNSNLTLNGNLVVTGNVTAVQSVTTQISDPLLTLGLGNPGTSYDLGLILTRGSGGNRFVGWKENLGAFVFLNTTEDGLTSGNIAVTSYAPVLLGNVTSTGTSTFGGITLSGNTISSAGAMTIRSDAGSVAIANATTISGATIISSTLSVSSTATVGSLVSNAGISGTTGTFSSNVTAAGLTSNSSITAITTMSAAGGIQNTPIGNVTPSTALFTTVGASGNVTVSALSVNNTATVGSTLGVVGNINGTSLTLTGSEVINGTLQVKGGIQATPIGNASASTGQFTTVSATGNVTAASLTSNGSATIGGTLGLTGNINGTGLTLSGSEVVSGTLQSVAGIQATPIGNVTASTGQFTSVSATGNVTAASLTSNGSATVGGTFGVTGNTTLTNVSATSATIGVLTMTAGLQNTPIGNATPNTGNFTTLNTSGNTTVNALTVNASATVGTTLGVGGAATVGSLSTAGTISTTNTTNATGASTGALQVTGGASVNKDLWVIGNIYAGNIIAVQANTISVQDPLLYLTANSVYPYNYTIGFYSQYVGGNPGNIAGNTYQHTGFARDHTDLTWKLFSNVAAEPTSVIDFTNAQWEPIKHGNLTVVGTASISGASSYGGNITAAGLTSNGSITAITTFSALGGIQNTPIGNATTSTAAFTTVSAATIGNSGAAHIGATSTLTGNAVSAGLTVNSSGTFGTTVRALGGIQATPIGNGTASTGQFTTLSATGNITGAGLTSNGSITAASTISATGGLQATPIGNGTASTGNFTTIGATGNISSITGLTISSGSATIATTLGVAGNINGTSLTLSGSQVTSGAAQVNTLTVNTKANVGSDLTVIGNVYIGTGANTAPFTTSPILVGIETASVYTQAAIQNLAGTGSADWTAYANNGTEVQGWVDVGFTGNLFNDANYTITRFNDGYIFANGVTGNSSLGGNLVIATGSGGATRDIVFATGGFTSNKEVMRFSNTAGALQIKTTTSATGATSGALQVSGGAGVAGNFYVAGSSTLGNITFNNLTLSSNVTNSGLNINPNGTGQTTINSGLAASRTVINGTAANTFVVSGTQVGIASNALISGATFQINAKDSMLLPTGALSDRPGTPATGMMRFTTSSNTIEWYDGANWKSPSADFTVVVANSQVGTGSTSVFTLPVSNASTSGTIVSINGVVQQPTAAYAISGNTVTFTEAPASTDVIDFRVFTTTSQITALLDAAGTTGVILDTPTTNSDIISFIINSAQVASIQANGTIITGNILPSANNVSNIGSVAMQYNTIFAKATSAQYADLAENYLGDAVYAPGQVLDFGGDAEVTLSSADMSTRVAGVVSSNPAYLMNSAHEGAGVVMPIALQGRVPCYVKGKVRKGDMMVSAGNGYARAEAKPVIGSVIGKALENFDGTTGIIEVVVGRV
jgi:hypothetical protein